jgi:hypothetical protein
VESYDGIGMNFKAVRSHRVDEWVFCYPLDRSGCGNGAGGERLKRGIFVLDPGLNCEPDIVPRSYQRHVLVATFSKAIVGYMLCDNTASRRGRF